MISNPTRKGVEPEVLTKKRHDLKTYRGGIRAHEKRPSMKLSPAVRRFAKRTWPYSRQTARMKLAGLGVIRPSGRKGG